jgi:3-hydroxyacyl-[acyl-carrier-protein] dehydratase
VGSELDLSTPVEELLPHRPPFLFVDSVLARDADRVTTDRDVAEELECFRGHYPGKPVFPGVLQCEMAFQSGAILLGAGPAVAGALPVLARIEQARFKRSVAPGQTVTAEVVLTERLANATWLSARLSSGGETVANLRFVLALAAREAEAAEGENA